MVGCVNSGCAIMFNYMIAVMSLFELNSNVITNLYTSIHSRSFYDPAVVSFWKWPFSEKLKI